LCGTRPRPRPPAPAPAPARARARPRPRPPAPAPAPARARPRPQVARARAERGARIRAPWWAQTPLLQGEKGNPARGGARGAGARASIKKRKREPGAHEARGLLL